jgi:hypothetical protein
MNGSLVKVYFNNLAQTAQRCNAGLFSQRPYWDGSDTHKQRATLASRQGQHECSPVFQHRAGPQPIICLFFSTITSFFLACADAVTLCRNRGVVTIVKTAVISLKQQGIMTCGGIFFTCICLPERKSR